jgi:hypothetical protein
MLDREQSFAKALSIIGVAPGVIGKVATVAAISSTKSNIDPGVVLYPSRKGFIKGAESEINRLDQFINDASGAYKDFLIDQQSLLKIEAESNKAFDITEENAIKRQFEKVPFSYSDDRSDIPLGNPIDYKQYYNGE